MQEVPIFVGRKKCVLTRDWLYREIKDRTNKVKGQSAVTIQAVYRSVKYSADYSARCKAVLGEGQMAALIKSTLTRLSYLERKWKFMPLKSRTSLHRVIRATTTRQNYYNERKKGFEHINRNDIQRYIYAFLQRQRYYEAKLLSQEGDKIAKERERFELYEGFTVKMNQDLLLLEQEAEQERWLMRLEEEHTHKLEDAKVLGKLAQAKEEEENLCDQQYNIGMARYRQIVKRQEVNERISHHLSTERHASLMAGAKQVVSQFLREQGSIPSDGQYMHTAPSLRQLPKDMENVTDWR